MEPKYEYTTVVHGQEVVVKHYHPKRERVRILDAQAVCSIRSKELAIFMAENRRD